MTTPKHTFIEDAQGLSMGVFFCGISVHLLTHLGLLTGQTAGLAVIVSYLTGWSFGAVFFVINIPFYLLAWFRMGPVFTFRSLLSVSLLSLVTTLLPYGWTPGEMNLGLGAVICGSIIGAGLLILFRHNGSMGGFGVLALLIQDKTGFRAGYVQLAADVVIFGVALFIFPFQIVAWSLLGAVVTNLVIAVNHRRDRYVAT
ncbi:MAG: YitT family protein [Yoonia sp.]|nr:YitT family protein [Yoonia sp.]MDG1863584.1 YitT family protein [Yoonia sp.]